MEADKNPFPEMNLGITDRAKEVGRKLIGLCAYYPSGYPSEYPKHPERRGAAAMLDAHLDDEQLVLQFEPSDGEAMEGYAEVSDTLRLPSEGWDSMGTYIVKSEYEG